MRQVEGGETLGQIGVCLLRKLGAIHDPRRRGLLEQRLGLGLVRSVEDGPNALGNGFALIESSDIGLRVLLQMQVAALPWHAAKSPGAPP